MFNHVSAASFVKGAMNQAVTEAAGPATGGLNTTGSDCPYQVGDYVVIGRSDGGQIVARILETNMNSDQYSYWVQFLTARSLGSLSFLMGSVPSLISDLRASSN